MESSTLKRNFILQQGLAEPRPEQASSQYSALVFQPRLVGLILLSGIVLQEPGIFFALAALLWWGALVPSLNLFDALYNALFSRRPGHVALSAAPGPRRFAQGMAGTFALVIGILLQLGWKVTAIVLEILFAGAVAALAFGGFCLGSFVFHVVRGRVSFACRTLPWSRGA